MAERTQASQSTAARLGRLEAEVEGIKGDISAVRIAVEKLSSNWQASTRPQWGILISLGSFIVLVLSSLIILGARGPLETQAEIKNRFARHLEIQADMERDAAYKRGRRDEKINVLEDRYREHEDRIDALECR